MKIIFAGTPEFAASALAALIDAGHDICAVFTQPDRPAGRGRKLTATAVKELALQHHLPVFQPHNLKQNSDIGLAAQQQIKDLNADIMVVAAYGLLLPQTVLDLPKYGCLNIHASLLPRWRGAAPIHRAIMAADETTGITIMQMALGLDTGDMLLQTRCPILNTDTTASLHDKLATQGATAICDALSSTERLQQLQAQRSVQDESLTSYAEKITKTEAKIEWKLPADQISLLIRGLNPWPIAFATLEQLNIKIHKAKPIKLTSQDLTQAHLGQVVAISDQGIDVYCGGHSLLRIENMQWPSQKAFNPHQIIQSKRIKLGDILL